ncbi:hypothetical protein C2845_PM03G34480 [Panicum miliaceum]|uniref:Uncharacterized protein n=1 Tax=Panicum miliaceum TaxID=4540 RepID=A0A3L6T958_PANMI|nr:hypothetical protein C2845_PM03G34480 [Panicum miliaceum]
MGMANRYARHGRLWSKNSECSLDSFVLTGLVEQSALQYVGFLAVEATIDEKAEILFLGQLSVTVVVLGVIFGITNTFRPFPDDVFRYDIKEPFKLQNGWLLWAGVGLFAAVISIALAGAAMTYLNGETPERESALEHIMCCKSCKDMISRSCWGHREGLDKPEPGSVHKVVPRSSFGRVTLHI